MVSWLKPAAFTIAVHLRSSSEEWRLSIV
ncbi:hypothetical protein CQW23_18335 [Capsicum baccatum]|uniref:Uncharacterized protein n=2 Tax=Capsicum TaxID=4071 RepID=Q6RYW4_CAPAN|nr:unknown [Capsicum annuum]PHT44310.1 hypothetical protein CQW23_18335 [Capsicum baccatum]